MIRQNLLWAQSAFRSRGFPTRVGIPATNTNVQVSDNHDLQMISVADMDSKGESISYMDVDNIKDTGCLLPFLDLMNHQYKSKIMWFTTKDRLAFIAMDSIPANVELFNNYGSQFECIHWMFAPLFSFMRSIVKMCKLGAKSNEEFLAGYGFCIPDNPEDQFTVVIAAAGTLFYLTVYLPFFLLLQFCLFLCCTSEYLF